MVTGSRAGHDSAEPFGPEQISPDPTAEGLKAEGLVAGRTRQGSNLILQKEKAFVKWGLFRFKGFPILSGFKVSR